jgi:hypothetical protein
LTNVQGKFIPSHIEYKVPKFIKTTNEVVKEVQTYMEDTFFGVNNGSGQPVEPEWMEDPFKLNDGVYKVGLGGLHSQHDTNFYVEATDEYLVSDFDVASYYPNIIMKAGLIPNLGGDKGELFLTEFRKIYEARMEAKRNGNKKVANSLKIVLNGTYGKLGSLYASFYAPDLMLGVTLTGQLNLLCLIADLEKTRGVKVLSANTDGIMVGYPKDKRDMIINKIAQNAKRTGFEYEETPYARVGMKDVNNYIAVTAETEAAVIMPNSISYAKSTGGKLKRKGLYAELGLMKNPTMQVCSDAAAEYLRSGKPVEDFIRECGDIKNFVAIRNVKGGGIQHTHTVEVDDWVGEPRNWRRPHWPDTKKSVTRVSRPAPVVEGRGGVPCGRVARWYMTTQEMPPITYIGSGNRVPKTEGSKLCLTLPDRLPKDLDLNWYIQETYQILQDLGVKSNKMFNFLLQSAYDSYTICFNKRGHLNDHSQDPHHRWINRPSG